MRRTIILVLLLIQSMLWGQSEPKDIITKSQEQIKIDGLEAISRLRIINSRGSVRERKIAMVSKLYDGGDTEKRLIRFLFPADVKGTGMLTFDYLDKDDDIWLYLPSLRKTRRIISTEKAGSFMGSEFTYADMTTFSIDDFNYSALADEIVDNVHCFVIKQIPKKADIEETYGFSSKTVFIGKKDYVIRKAIYYDLDGELLKELFTEDIRLVDIKNSKYRVFKMTVKNFQNKRISEMIIDELKLNNNIKDDYFTSRYLERR